MPCALPAPPPSRRLNESSPASSTTTTACDSTAPSATSPRTITSPAAALRSGPNGIASLTKPASGAGSAARRLTKPHEHLAPLSSNHDCRVHAEPVHWGPELLDAYGGRRPWRSAVA